MKRILAVVMLFCIALMLPLYSFGAEPVPSIAINYQPGSCHFDFYMIASVDEDMGIALASPFDEYVKASSTLGDIDFYDANEMRILATTLEALILRDSVAPKYTGETDSEGKLLLSGVEKGIYLVIGEKTVRDGVVYTPSPIFVSVPRRNSTSEDWKYDVNVEHTKYEKEEICGRCKELKVMKIWCGDEEGDKRPESINVQLLRDGELYETVTLTAENNWTYIWKGLSSEYEWKAVEEKVPEQYSMTVERNGDLIVIKNTYEGPPPPPPPVIPPTGQLWWPVPVMLIVGLTLFVIGWLQRRYL